MHACVMSAPPLAAPTTHHPDRHLLLPQELSHATPSGGDASSGPRSAAQLQQAYQEAYEQLLRYGFTTQQVQDALSALPQHTVSTESALDWLCLHVPPGELPRRFVGQGRAAAAAAAAGGITVKVGAASSVQPESAW
jgi:hypothetical protein